MAGAHTLPVPTNFIAGGSRAGPSPTRRAASGSHVAESEAEAFLTAPAAVDDHVQEGDLKGSSSDTAHPESLPTESSNSPKFVL